MRRVKTESCRVVLVAGLLLIGLFFGAACSSAAPGAGTGARQASRCSKARGSSWATAARPSRTPRSSSTDAASPRSAEPVRCRFRRARLAWTWPARPSCRRSSTRTPISVSHARGARRPPAAQGVLRRRRGHEPGPGHGRCGVPGARRDDPQRRAVSHRRAAGSRCRSRAAPRLPYWITTEAEARKAVQELAARKVDLVKIWVDDRDGKYKKLTPELYGAIIDEAHKNGLRVTAHIFDARGCEGPAARRGSTRSRTACATRTSTRSSSR